MCGIAGVWDQHGRRAAPLADDIAAMIATLGHRGPDGSGTWLDEAAGVGLGQRRLAVVDLSEAGRQPMASHCGRYLLVYNGEIYNARDLARALEQSGPIAWRGHSDTEVLLEACARWGLERTLDRLIGMFAFALWDRAERRLVLVRDRLGIKPLYWSCRDGLILFGSELKALVAHPALEARLDRAALAAYLRYGSVPSPLSILQGVAKLAPGRLVVLEEGREPRPHCWWALQDVARAGIAARRAFDEEAAVEELDGLIRDAVAKRLVADVPLGAFLSGGIDSSTVVGAMQTAAGGRVKTFAVGFADSAFDEAQHARAVATHLGTEHSELHVSAQDARAVIPDLARWYDEPFADSSQIPTHLVSRLARQAVTVSLSGDGGDELFGGYQRYRWIDLLWRRAGILPPALRRALAGGGRALPLALWDRLGAALPAARRFERFGDKVDKGLALLAAPDGDAMYRALFSQWPDPAALLPGVAEPPGVLDTRPAGLESLVERLMYYDTLGYLPDDILTKVDRASMAVGLEVRVPLLDHRIVEFAWGVPLAAKLRDGQGKWLLRRVLDRYLPRELYERPKAGFAVPLADWLRGPLRDWAGDLLSPERLRAQGLFRPEPVEAFWHEHQSGRRDRHFALWNLCVLQAWLDRWRVAL